MKIYIYIGESLVKKMKMVKEDILLKIMKNCWKRKRSGRGRRFSEYESESAKDNKKGWIEVCLFLNSFLLVSLILTCFYLLLRITFLLPSPSFALSTLTLVVLRAGLGWVDALALWVARGRHFRLALRELALWHALARRGRKY